MPNPNYSDHGSDLVSNQPTRKAKMAPASVSMKEKACFPGADLPGKSQPKERSAGVKKAKVYPNSKGL